MNTPRFITTPAGVRIGCAWSPPPPRIDRDLEQVQAALLEQRTAQRPSTLARILAPVWRWL